MIYLRFVVAAHRTVFIYLLNQGFVNALPVYLKRL
jgi:hypothetical protein